MKTELQELEEKVKKNKKTMNGFAWVSLVGLVVMFFGFYMVDEYDDILFLLIGGGIAIYFFFLMMVVSLGNQKLQKRIQELQSEPQPLQTEYQYDAPPVIQPDAPSFCPYCGNRLADMNIVYCESCGRKIR